MKFRLASQGLLLVGIPLLFEVLLFLSFSDIVSHAQVAAEKAMHANRIQISMSKFLLESLRLFNSAAHNEINDPAVQSKVTANLSGFEVAMAELDATFQKDKDSPIYPIMVPELEWWHKNGSGLLRMYRRRQITDLMGSLQAENDDPMSHLHQIVRQVQASRGVAEQILNEEPARQAALKNGLQSLLLFGLVAGIGLSVFLARFFSVHITQRLQVIADNSVSLLSGGGLNPPVSGSDEITDLDKQFREMFAEIRAVQAKEKAVQTLKEQVVSAVAMQLSEPLQDVASFFERLDKQSMPEDVRSLLATATHTVDQMRLLTNDLRELESLKQDETLILSKESFAVSEVVAEAREAVSGVAALKNVAITTAGDAVVNADRRRIVQVLTNLLTNAVKFSPEGSSVSAIADCENGFVSVKVSDRGRGIAGDKLQTIFNPFEQAEKTDSAQFGGSGLGLAICKMLVECHGGTISVESQAGTGSTFTFTIPEDGTVIKAREGTLVDATNSVLVDEPQMKLKGC